MVYQRFVKRGGKTFGPYFYESKLSPDGKVKSVYVGKDEQKTIPFQLPVQVSDPAIELLKRNIAVSEQRKEQLKKKLIQLRNRQYSGELSYTRFEFLQNQYLRGKSFSFWVNYYDSYKQKAESKIEQITLGSMYSAAVMPSLSAEDKKPSLETIAQKQETSGIEQEVSSPSSNVFSGKIITLLLIFFIAGFGGAFLMQGFISDEQTSTINPELLTQGFETSGVGMLATGAASVPVESTQKSLFERIMGGLNSGMNSITGFATGLGGEDISVMDNTTAPVEEVTAENVTMPSENMTNLTETNITMPLENATEINLTETNVSMPAENITLPQNVTQNITEEFVAPANETLIQHEAVVGKQVMWTKKVRLEKEGKTRIELPEEAIDVTVRKKVGKSLNAIPSGKLKRTAKANNSELTITENATEIEVDYYTPAPEITEIKEGNFNKQFTIYSKLHYANVTAFASITEVTANETSIKLYWEVNETSTEVKDVDYIDSDSDDLIDALQWTVPHLSNQTYRLILITKAKHLDENREVISDIYDDVKELDGNWSEEIPAGDYVRVTFEQQLNYNNDITIYPRIVSGNPRVEVYQVDSTVKIAEFTTIIPNEYNKIYLRNLPIVQDTFDLRVVGGSLEFDYIVDPNSIVCTTGTCVVTFTTTNTTNWTVPTGITSITGLVIGGGGGGSTTSSSGGGGDGGDLRYSSAISVTAGDVLTITVGIGGVYAAVGGSGGNSTIRKGTTVLLAAAGGGGGNTSGGLPKNGTSSTTGGAISGGNGGEGGTTTAAATSDCGGGGGAGGYTGNGGAGGNVVDGNGANGTGGGGGGGGAGGSADVAGEGGGVGINGQGANGTGGAAGAQNGKPGTGGSGGQDGAASGTVHSVGALYGGGGAGDDNGAEAGRGGNGSVVITYLEPNDNPLFAPISSFSLNEDFGTFDINVTNNISDTEDADNLLNISYTMNTSSLFTISVSNITKVATFTSLPNTYGSREVNLTVFDTAGKKNTTTFMLTVNPVNDAPTFSAISSFSLTEDFSPYNIVASANISDNETADASLGISYTMNATGIFTIGVVNATSTITFTSLPNAYGSREVNLTVWDEDLSNTTTFTLTVNSVNDLPVFSSYYVNDTLLGNNQWARFNMSVNDTSDPAGGISSANGTINSINTSFTKDTADNWYYDFQCTASDTSVDFTAAWANDTDNAANTTVIGGIATECDAVPPQITLAKINATSTVITGTVVKVNASITDPETHLSSVWLSVEPPSAVHYNTTVTNSGSQYYNETIILTEVGKYIFRFYANDTLGQLNVSNATDLDNNQYIEAISAASAPVIYEITSILSQTITESSTTDVQFNVYAYDAQGVETMANSSAMNASAALTSETTRYNASCEKVENINLTAANYSCTIRMWYWDGAGDWTVNISLNDTTGLIADTKNTTFTLASTPSMVMAPLSLAWDNIVMTALNQTPTNNPIILNNTGNKPITDGNIKVTAIDMQGASIATEYLRSANFKIGPSTSAQKIECAATTMVNQTSIAVSGAALAKGNNTEGYGNSTLYFCLANVTTGITPQAYSTATSGKWTITIS